MSENQMFPVPETRYFDREALAATAGVDRAALNHMSVDQADDLMHNTIIVRLVKDVLSYPVGEAVVEFPASLRDHARREACARLGRLGRWWLRRHPVRYEYRVISARALFLESKIEFPPELGAPRFAMRVSDGWFADED